jgi:alkanesulfonate monooxygenase SsuD/methylene tetrahydromethanopterin reductase-like flavin-dependent oxidoreductase (luciferase family)
VPSQGSIETIEWAAHPSRRYPFLVTFSAREAVVRNLTAYRDQCRQFGYEADPGQLGWAAPVYVADTEEKAQNEARIAVEALFNDFLTLPPEMLLPPGYTSAQSLKKIIATKKAIGRGGFGPGGAPRQTLERLMELGTALVGTPKTVLAQIEKVREQTQLGNFVAMLQFGTLNNELTRRNQVMFASEVMPHLQAL